jgi:hypothetical protein
VTALVIDTLIVAAVLLVAGVGLALWWASLDESDSW